MEGQHKLTAVNEADRVAMCTECGAVDVYPNGTYSGKQQWRCGPAARALQRRLLEKRNPNARRYRRKSQ